MVSDTPYLFTMKKFISLLCLVLFLTACSDVKLVDVQEEKAPITTSTEPIKTTATQVIKENKALQSQIEQGDDTGHTKHSEHKGHEEEKILYQIDTSASKLTWTGKKPGLSFSGTVPISSGFIHVEDDTTLHHGEFVLDMTGINTQNQGLEDHLKDEDFFDVTTHKTAKIYVKPFTLVEGNTFTAEADLTIKGITNKITFPAEIIIDGDIITANATLSIDRTKWDVKYGSGSVLGEIGDNIIDDQIGFVVELRLEREKAEGEVDGEEGEDLSVNSEE